MGVLRLAPDGWHTSVLGDDFDDPAGHLEHKRRYADVEALVREVVADIPRRGGDVILDLR